MGIKMTARQQLEHFLKEHQINYAIPTNIRDDESIFESIHATCTKLVVTKPSLLSPGNLQNLETLMNVARDAIFFTGTYNAQYETRRPFYFQAAINRLFNQNPCVLNQYTFNAICRIATANLDQIDIEHIAECFVLMGKANLLTRQNVQNLIENVIKASLRMMTAQRMMTFSGESIEGPTLYERSRAEKLKDCLSACGWMVQEDFNLVINSKVDIDTLSLYMQNLYEKGLNTTANCQALIESKIAVDVISNGLLVNTQIEFNADILRICDEKLRILEVEIAMINSLDDRYKAIQQHALSLYQKLCEIRNTEETEKDPRNFLHTIVIINNALPTKNNKPAKDDIDELITLGQVSKGHPSSQWKTLGLTMMLLGATIAIAAGIVLTVSTLGIATPIGMGIAAAGSAGIVSALAGIGLFTYGNARTGLSKNIIDLAEAIPQSLSL